MTKVYNNVEHSLQFVVLWIIFSGKCANLVCTDCTASVSGGHCITECDPSNTCDCKPYDFNKCSHTRPGNYYAVCGNIDVQYPVLDFSCKDEENKTCYKFHGQPFPSTVNWTEANRICVALGFPGLASISRIDTQEFMERTLLARVGGSFDRMWIGGYRAGRGRKWQWISRGKGRSEIPPARQYFTTAAILKDDQHCILLEGKAQQNFKWNDYFCDNRHFYSRPYVTSYLCGTELLGSITTEITTNEITTDGKSVKLNTTVQFSDTKAIVDDKISRGLLGGGITLLIIIALVLFGIFIKRRKPNWLAKLERKPKTIEYHPKLDTTTVYSANTNEAKGTVNNYILTTVSPDNAELNNFTEEYAAIEKIRMPQNAHCMELNQDSETVFVENDLYATDSLSEDAIIDNELYNN